MTFEKISFEKRNFAFGWFVGSTSSMIQIAFWTIWFRRNVNVIVKRESDEVNP